MDTLSIINVKKELLYVPLPFRQYPVIVTDISMGTNANIETRKCVRITQTCTCNKSSTFLYIQFLLLPITE